MNEMGGMGPGLLRLYALGAPALILRNVAMMIGFFPSQMGSSDQWSWATFALGGVLVSHPFEVARTLIVAHEKSHFTGRTFRTL